MYSDFDSIVFSFNFSSVVVCIFHFYCSVFLVFVLPSGVIKNDCQTTTEKVQSSARDGTSSATVHS